MTLTGLPDFDQPLSGGDGHVWRAFGLSGWLSAASSLALAEKHLGMPHVLVDLYRPFMPDGLPKPFGHLDVVFRTDHDEARQIAAVRKVDFAGQLRRAQPAGGRLHLVAASSENMDSSLTQPRDIHPLAAERIRFSAELTPDGASQIAQMIEAGTMPLAAEMTLRYDGVSPRLPMTAVFDPKALLSAVHERMDGDTISLPGLAKLIEASLPDLPFERVGLERDGDEGRLGVTMADRMAARFGDIDTSTDGTIRLAPADTIQQSRFSWDLSKPVRTARWIAISSDPFEPLRGEDAAALAERHVNRTTMQILPTGGHRVWAYANCPVPFHGAERLGVNLSTPANPPHRPHPISTSIVFDEAAMEQTKDIFLSPGEPFSLQATGFAIIHDKSGLQQPFGTPKPVPQLGTLVLSPEDFGLRALTFEASPGLLEIADAVVTVTYWSGGHQTTREFTLNFGRTDLGLALPLDASEPEVSVELARSGEAGRIDLGLFPAGHTYISLAAVPAFGAHEVIILCPAAEQGALAAIDIAPTDRFFDPNSVETLTFSADQPRRIWRYFASNPFRSGFRWRFHKPDQRVDEGWHDETLASHLTITPPAATQELSNGEKGANMTTINLEVDYGNGSTKAYSQIEVCDGATIHDVFETASTWQPPLRCDVRTQFTDRGGTNRNYLAEVDGVPGGTGRTEGASSWTVKANGDVLDLNTPSEFSLRNSNPNPPPPIEKDAHVVIARSAE